MCWLANFRERDYIAVFTSAKKALNKSKERCSGMQYPCGSQDWWFLIYRAY
jgi:hypothetical protein